MSHQIQQQGIAGLTRKTKAPLAGATAFIFQLSFPTRTPRQGCRGLPFWQEFPGLGPSCGACQGFFTLAPQSSEPRSAGLRNELDGSRKSPMTSNLACSTADNNKSRNRAVWRGCPRQRAPDSLSPCCARCVTAHPFHVPLPHIPRVRDFRLSDRKLSHCTAARHFSGKQQFRLSGPRFSLLGAANPRGQLGRMKPASEPRRCWNKYLRAACSWRGEGTSLLILCALCLPPQLKGKIFVAKPLTRSLRMATLSPPSLGSRVNALLRRGEGGRSQRRAARGGRASPLKAHRHRAISGQQRAGFVTCEAQPSFLQTHVNNGSSGVA